MQADVVGRGEQLVELQPRGCVLGGRLVHRVGVGEDERDVEARQQLGHALADAPEPDEADRRPAQLAAEELLGLPADPFAAAEDLVGLDHPPPGRLHQRDGELGRRVRQDVGRVRRAQAARADRVGVDVVEADGEVRDDLELSTGAVEQVAVDGDGGIGDDARARPGACSSSQSRSNGSPPTSTSKRSVSLSSPAAGSVRATTTFMAMPGGPSGACTSSLRDGLLRARPAVSVRSAGAAHQRGHDALPPRQAPPDVRRQGQRRARGHRPGGRGPARGAHAADQAPDGQARRRHEQRRRPLQPHAVLGDDDARRGRASPRATAGSPHRSARRSARSPAARTRSRRRR